MPHPDADRRLGSLQTADTRKRQAKGFVLHAPRKAFRIRLENMR